MGHGSTLVNRLVQAVAGVGGSGAGHLLPLLLPSDVKKLLQLVELTLEEAPVE